MNLFQNTLSALMLASDPPLQQGDLAVLTGISQATISRILSGRAPMPEQVGQICAAIPGGRERRLELLLAWLRDCAEVGKIAGIDDRHFILGPAQDVPGYAGTLSAELELIARESVAHEDIRAAVSELARMLRRHHAELADARATVLPFSAPSKPAPGVVVSPEVADKIPGALAAVAKAKRNFHA